MYRGLLVFLTVAVVTARISAEFTVPSPTPTKPSWPLQFDAPFGLTTPLYKNQSSHFYYNWDINATLISYPTECLPGVSTSPCNLLFVPAGTYLILNPQDASKATCCLKFPGVGSVPPDFLRTFNFTGVQNVLNMYGQSVPTNSWDAGGGFKYWTDLVTGEDIQFQEGGKSQWNFGASRAAPQPSSIFAVPSFCKPTC